MRWATRAGIHIDRAACAWLIRRYVDERAEFLFVCDPADIPAGAAAFDIPGAELSHHGGDCSFETILRRYDLTDPPEAPGLDVVLRGLSMIRGDEEILRITGPVFDGIYEYCKRSMLLGREPS